MLLLLSKIIYAPLGIWLDSESFRTTEAPGAFHVVEYLGPDPYEIMVVGDEREILGAT